MLKKSAKKTIAPPATFSQQRAAMVEGQLRPNKINTPTLLARFGQVPREHFLAPSAQASAYLDQPAPIGQGRETPAPMAAARLLQALNLTPQSRLLVLEGGSGYTAAIAAPLVSRLVFSESNPTLAATAQNLLQPYPNVSHNLLQTAPDTLLFAHYFNAILIEPAFEHLSIFQALPAMLAEGGIIAGIRLTPLPTLFTLTKQNKTMIHNEITETKAHLSTTYQASPAFQF